MKYQCPRCGSAVKRGYNRGAQAIGGLVGVLFASAFGAFQCEKCGKIPRSQVPPEIRQKMTIGSVLMAGGAILLFIIIVVILFNLNT